MQEIIILTMRNVVEDNANNVNSEIVSEIIQYVNCNFQSRKILDEFCKQYHFTPQYISRKFKQETKHTIRDYQQKVRMEKCCELLVGSNIPISEIAQSVGYRDIKFFNSLFKRILKMTPREYRKMSLREEYETK